MDVLNWLLNQPHILTGKPNYRLIPVTHLDATSDNAVIFNDVYAWLRDTYPQPHPGVENKYKREHTITRTYSGGISLDRAVFVGPCWDIRASGSGVELTIIIPQGCWRVQFRTGFRKAPDNVLYGRQAMTILTSVARAMSINIEDYAVENGFQIQQEILKPHIKLLQPVADMIINGNAHHIDIHSAYAAGIVTDYPELRPLFEAIYNQRKSRPIYKSVLTNSIGMMHSKTINYRFANLAKSAINTCYHRVEGFIAALTAAGRIPIMTNTDGVWYMGDIFHGFGEGKALGEWENDHHDCKLRIRSVGCYEYIDYNNKYTPVLRGHTCLDNIKPRETWEWGDIYDRRAYPIMFGYNPDVGIIDYTEREVCNGEE